MTWRQRNLFVFLSRRHLGIAHDRRGWRWRALVERHMSGRRRHSRFIRMRFTHVGFRLGRERNSCRGGRGLRGRRRLERIERPGRPQQRAPGERFGNALQLGNRHANRKDNETADERRGSGYNERIPKAEFIDRNAISDHGDAQHDGNGAENKQQNRHTHF